MARTIRVHTIGENGMAEIKEVSIQEARKILEDAYNDDFGSVVADIKTREIIWEIGPNVEEIIIVQAPLGGG